MIDKKFIYIFAQNFYFCIHLKISAVSITFYNRMLKGTYKELIRSKVLFADEEISHTEKLIDSCDQNYANFNHRNPEKGINIFLVFVINRIFFWSTIFLKLNACCRQCMHAFGKGISVLEVFAFKQSLRNFHGLDLLAEFCLSVILNYDTADWSACDKCETDFINNAFWYKKKKYFPPNPIIFCMCQISPFPTLSFCLRCYGWSLDSILLKIDLALLEISCPESSFSPE